LKTHFNQSTVTVCALLPSEQYNKEDCQLWIWESNNMTVAKVVELIGSSPNSWEDATKNAIAEAAKTVRGIKSVYLKRTRKVFYSE
jgi:hypothetical protein